MCYNAAKNWQIGWYNDRKLELFPVNEDSNWSTSLQMVGIANYQNETSSNLPVVVKLETNTEQDYFVAFNRATGVNSDNDEADDEVTIVQVSNGDGNAYSQSYLRATLLEGEVYQIDGFGGLDRNITVRHLSIDKTNSDGVWRSNIWIGTDEATFEPTRSPSSSPVSMEPTSSPSLSPVTSEQTATGSPSYEVSKLISYPLTFDTHIFCTKEIYFLVDISSFLYLILTEHIL